MKGFFGNLISIVLAVLVLTNCPEDKYGTSGSTGGGSGGGNTDNYEHPWLNPHIDEDWYPGDEYVAKDYPDQDFVISQLGVEVELMKDTYKKRYIYLLQSQEYVEIPKAEANRISMNKFKGHSKKYLVVRALCLFPSGDYDVILRDNDLDVIYYVMTTLHPNLKEDALVVEVESIPVNFYVNVSVSVYL